MAEEKDQNTQTPQDDSDFTHYEEPEPGDYDDGNSFKGAAIAMILMFLMFLAAAGIAAYLYINQEDCNSTDPCLGKVSTDQCGNYVNCEEECECDDAMTISSLEEVKTLAQPLDITNIGSKYYLEYEVCVKWSEEGAVGAGAVCEERENVSYELHEDSRNLIITCGDEETSESYLSTAELVEDPELFEGYKCSGEGAQGNKLFVVNEKVIVMLENSN